MGRTPETLKLFCSGGLTKQLVELFTWEKIRFCRPSKTAFGCKQNDTIIKKNFLIPFLFQMKLINYTLQ
jgi:hypothetical protein